MIQTHCPKCGALIALPTARDTAGRLADIKAAWRQGITAREIARQIGVSRTSILGYYHRHADALADCPLGGRRERA